MKSSLVAVAVAAMVAAAGTASAGISGGAVALMSAKQSDALVLVGPVEAVYAGKGFAIVLGQKVEFSNAGQLSVGETVSVIGHVNADGSVSAKSVQKGSLYVAGATPVLLTGVVQKVNASVGTAVVSGLTVDLTALMANGAVSVAKGSTVTLSGIQPLNGGLVVVSGISGGAVSTSGISGGAVSTSGISGGAVAMSGISGGAVATSGISGGAVKTSGISGGAVATSGISGGAVKTSGISGGAVATSGISGGAVKTSGISGGAVATSGISGGAVKTSGISGGAIY